MTFGIQMYLHNKPIGWATNQGQRMEFATEELAHQELSLWQKHGWWPSTVRYLIKPIEAL